MNEFVIRPGRALVVWEREGLRGATIRVSSDIAVSLSVSADYGSVTGYAGSSSAAREHELMVNVDGPAKLTLHVRNASGTRKARGTFEVSSGRARR